jgi:hypothetical protein
MSAEGMVVMIFSCFVPADYKDLPYLLKYTTICEKRQFRVSCRKCQFFSAMGHGVELGRSCPATMKAVAWRKKALRPGPGFFAPDPFCGLTQCLCRNLQTRPYGLKQFAIFPQKFSMSLQKPAPTHAKTGTRCLCPGCADALLMPMP